MKRSFLILTTLLILPLFILGQDNTSFKENATPINGSGNTALGTQAGVSNESKGNVFLGQYSGFKNAKGEGNVFVGYSSATKGEEGSLNVFNGYESGVNNIGNANTFLGYRTGYENFKGTGNVYIGYQAGYNKDRNNTLYIENSSSGEPLIWGDFKSDIVNVNGSLGIGTESPAESLHIMGNIRGNSAGGALRVKTTSGYMDIGSQNATFGHIYTDRPRIILNKDVFTVTGGFCSYVNRDLTLKTNQTARLTINSETGNVGVGTVSPSGKFEVIGNSGQQQQGQVHVVGDGSNGNGDAYISFYEGSENNSKWSAGVRDNGNQFSISHGLTMDAEPRLVIMDVTGNVGIGTSTPDEKLSVNGKIHTQEVRVDMTGWPDYVFATDYNLPTLKEVESQIEKEGHLQNIPSAQDVINNGIQLGEMNAKLLQKIEELTLYAIQQQKDIEEQKQQNKTLEKRLERLELIIKE